MKREVLGISTVVATMILTSVLLVIVMSASFLANNALTGQVENAEFDQAKDVMLALNNMVRDVMYKPSSSRYVKTGFRTTVPQLESTGENVSVWVQVSGEPREYLIQNNPINIVKIQGGTMVDESNSDVVGTSSVLLTDSLASLGHVYVERSGRAELVLDFARARVIYTGNLTTFDEVYNVVEVAFVNMTLGTEQAHTRAVFIIRNLGISVSQFSYTGELTIGVEGANDNNASITLTELMSPYTPNNSTLVNLVVINVEVSLVGGT